MNKDRHLQLSILILLLAAFTRFWELGVKPPHFDEGVNGWFVDQMTKNGFFQYDPTNYHGPLHFYILFVAQTLFGRSVEVLRTPGVLAGIGVVWLALFGFRRYLGAGASVLFGCFLAVSPAMIFVSRYAIHEIWMLLFIMLTALGVMDGLSGRFRACAWLVCMGIAGMVLNKETYVIHLGCFALALPTWWAVRYFKPDRPNPVSPEKRGKTAAWKEFPGPAALGLGLVLFFYSGNLLHLEGVRGLYETFQTWTDTGLEGSGHEKDWAIWGPYWLNLMWRYEWAALAGVVAGLRFVWPSPGPLRWLVIAGAGTLVAYSMIPYKTPWCLIVIIWTFPLSLAVVLDEAWKKGWLIPVAAVFVLVMAHDLWAGWRVNQLRFDDPDEPFVYVQTFREMRGFTEPLREARRRDPRILHAAGAVVVDSPYPLPWELGDFTRVGYYKKTLSPSVAQMDFLLVEETRRFEIEPQLRGRYYVQRLRMREGFEPVSAYFRESVFAPEFEGEAGLRSGVEKLEYPVEVQP